jgi:hypothetical protein
MVRSLMISIIAELMNIAHTMVALNRPASRDYRSVKNYFNGEAPLCADEHYIYHKEDIITLKPGRENAWLDGIVERILQKLTCAPVRVSSRNFKCSQFQAHADDSPSTSSAPL